MEEKVEEFVDQNIQPNDLEQMTQVLSRYPYKRKKQEIQKVVEFTQDIKFFREYVDKGMQNIHFQCCRFMSMQKYEQNDYVFQISKLQVKNNKYQIGDKFYIILKGSVSILAPPHHYEEPKQNARRNKMRQNNQIHSQEIQEPQKIEPPALIPVQTLFQGQSFGEMALLYQTPRKASILCLEDCVILVLLKNHFINILSSSQEQLIAREIKYIKSVGAFSELSNHALRDIYLNTKQIDVIKDQTIFLEGDQTRNVYIIQSGSFTKNDYPINFKKYFENNSLDSLLINQINDSTKEIQCTIVSNSELIGQEDVILNKPYRSFSFQCISGEGSLVVIEDEYFKQKVLQYESVVDNTIQNIKQKQYLHQQRLEYLEYCLENFRHYFLENRNFQLYQMKTDERFKKSAINFDKLGQEKQMHNKSHSRERDLQTLRQPTPQNCPWFMKNGQPVIQEEVKSQLGNEQEQSFTHQGSLLFETIASNHLKKSFNTQFQSQQIFQTPFENQSTLIFNTMAVDKSDVQMTTIGFSRARDSIKAKSNLKINNISKLEQYLAQGKNKIDDNSIARANTARCSISTNAKTINTRRSNIDGYSIDFIMNQKNPSENDTHRQIKPDENTPVPINRKADNDTTESDDYYDNKIQQKNSFFKNQKPRSVERYGSKDFGSVLNYVNKKDFDLFHTQNPIKIQKNQEQASRNKIVRQLIGNLKEKELMIKKLEIKRLDQIRASPQKREYENYINPKVDAEPIDRIAINLENKAVVYQFKNRYIKKMTPTSTIEREKQSFVHQSNQKFMINQSCQNSIEYHNNEDSNEKQMQTRPVTYRQIDTNRKSFDSYVKQQSHRKITLLDQSINNDNSQLEHKNESKSVQQNTISINTERSYKNSSFYHANRKQLISQQVSNERQVDSKVSLNQTSVLYQFNMPDPFYYY